MIIVEIAGHLGADPEERFTPNGKRVITLRVATRVRKDETVWWKVTIWDDRFDKMLPFLKKGSAVIIVGEMHKPETYTGRDGTTQVSMSMNAEMVKFSPFGRTDKPSESHSGQGEGHGETENPFAGKTSSAYGSNQQFAGAGAPFESDSPFAGDDLPF